MGGHDEEQAHKQRQLADVGEAEIAAAREFEQQCKQQHAEDVVDHSRTQHHLAFGAVLAADIAQDAHRYADAGGRERTAHEQRQQRVLSERIAANQEAQRAGDDEAP